MGIFNFEVENGYVNCSYDYDTVKETVKSLESKQTNIKLAGSGKQEIESMGNGFICLHYNTLEQKSLKEYLEDYDEESLNLLRYATVLENSEYSDLLASDVYSALNFIYKRFGVGFGLIKREDVVLEISNVVTKKELARVIRDVQEKKVVIFIPLPARMYFKFLPKELHLILDGNNVKIRLVSNSNLVIDSKESKEVKIPGVGKLLNTMNRMDLNGKRKDT